VSSHSIFRYVTAPAPRYLMRLSLIEQMLDFLPLQLNRFLEIGPGLGDLSFYLLDRYQTISGELFDISKTSIEIIRRRKNIQSRLKLYNSNFFESNIQYAYDLVLSCEVFEHIKNDEEAFEHVRRSLYLGGHFLFSVPAFQAKWSDADKYGGHVRRYEKEEVVSKFAAHGFRIIHFWSYGYPLIDFIGPFSQLYYRSLIRKGNLSLAESTKRSGTYRAIWNYFPVIPMSIFLNPFFFLQGKNKERNKGDGFIVLATRES
jgi:SAM-dependent methyltransferase